MGTKSILKFEDVLIDFNNGMGVEKLALKYHVGKLKIKSLLLENGVEMKKRGGQKQNTVHPEELTPEMTETEMVKKLGYDRIWDCGLIKYIWKKPEE